MRDIAADIHRVLHGGSDKANAPTNKDEDWQRGYKHGSEHEGSGLAAIHFEWRRIGSPKELPDSFRQWKRGFWAAKVQRAFAQTVKL